jgi:hypothetical protein
MSKALAEEASAQANATAPAAEPDDEAAGACEWPEVSLACWGWLAREVSGRLTASCRLEGVLRLLDCSGFEQVPKQVVLREKFWAFLQTVTVDAAEGEESLGYVQCSAFAWDSEQVWYDKNGEALAFSRHKWAQTSSIFFRDTVHVEDCNKRDMGEISNDLQSSGVSEVTLMTISAPDGRVIATSQSQDADTTVHIIDSASGKKLATVHKIKGWGPTDSWTLEIDPEAQETGNVAADPRILILALASESAAVAWGLGAAGFLCIIAFFVGICACLCIHMMRNADAKDPRFGILGEREQDGEMEWARASCAAGM